MKELEPQTPDKTPLASNYVVTGLESVASRQEVIDQLLAIGGLRAQIEIFRSQIRSLEPHALISAQQAGLTQVEIAQLLGITQAGVSDKMIKLSKEA